MKRALLAVVTLCSILSSLAAARADGCYIPLGRDWAAQRERAYINEPEQKAVIFFHQGTEDLIISPSFAGSSSQFAWVVPVPARPEVKTVEGALFHELARLAFPNPPVTASPMAERSVTSASAKVTVLERKEVGAYDVSVLSASDSDALMQWLHSNGYHLPAKAEAPVQAYVHENWTFVACRIKNGISGSGLHTGTLAPLRLTFPTKYPMYPMRLSAANPGSFHVLNYILVPSEEAPAKLQVLRPINAPDEPSFTTGARRLAQVDEDQTEYPTLARLSHQALRVFVSDANTVSPANCTDDLRWFLPNTEPVAEQDTSKPEPHDPIITQPGSGPSTGDNPTATTGAATQSSTGASQPQNVETTGPGLTTILLLVLVGIGLAGLYLLVRQQSVR